MDFDARVVMLLIWGGGSVAVWGQVLLDSIGQYRVYSDIRARRELVVTSALFAAAFCSALAIFLLLFGEDGRGLRGFATAISLGAFFACGFYLLNHRR